MNSPYTAVQYYPEFPFHRLRDPSSCLSWRESSFLTTMSQNQSAQTSDFFSQDVFNQLFDMLDQSAIHSVQPIELNFTERPTDGSTGNTIQISMDCITMHEPDEMHSVRGLCSLELVINDSTPTTHFPLHPKRGVVG
ncbi:tumor protein 63-like [Stegastes partitus]|uniref:Tumor protein 63-like n=1 Tax=Stegastes partitus TaxID=144197 RepID=A0A9Y4N8J3_9TELE|nr:PREDICTED: tumor protein 63-like [Stegastes partitus]